METGQRGYIITGDPAYLEPYEAGIAKIRTQIEHVEQLTAGYEDQQARLAALKQHAEAALTDSKRTLDARRNGGEEGKEEARSIILAGEGKREMDAIRRIAEEMRDAERGLLGAREEESHASLRATTVTNIVGTILGMALIALAFFLYQRDSRAREQAEARLRRANEQLESRVAERTEALRQAIDNLLVEVDDRKRAEQEAKGYSTELQRSNRELQEFAAVASHDLQEPLRKIEAFGNRLQANCGENLGERGREYLQRLRDSARRMRTLISDLLKLSRITTDAKPHVSVNLNSVAYQVVSDLEALIQQTGGEVRLGDLPTVIAEPTQMRQLLQNLIGNALKFHRADTPPLVEVCGRLIAAESAKQADAKRAEPSRCEIMVRDNGIGFDERYLDRIFTVFQRLHGRDEYEGTGMGLAICRKIADHHGGTLTAHSVPGVGSTFTCALPVRASSPERSAALEREQAGEIPTTADGAAPAPGELRSPKTELESAAGHHAHDTTPEAARWAGRR